MIGPGRSAPLSSAQLGLWLLDRLYPGEALYNEVQAVRLVGRLDARALEGALDASVRRHAILRTAFRVENGEPRQSALPEARVPLPLEDLRGRPAGEREAAALERARAEAGRPFELACAPLIRARLYRLDEAEHWLVLTAHHIVTDGWSTSVLWQELAANYSALRDGWTLDLPPLPAQYADWAAAERAKIQQPAFAQSLDWWKRRLDGLPALELPFDRPRPALADHRGANVTIRVDADLARRLKETGRAARATPFMTYLAAYCVLLHRISGAGDFAVGTPVAGRNDAGVEPMIGLFVNMLALRCDLSGDTTFNELLARVRQRALDAYAHEDVPFERLVAALAPARDAARNPLFQASFGLLGAGPRNWRLPGLVVEPIDGVDNGTAKFDLSLSIAEADDGCTARFDFPTAMLDRSTVECWARAFSHLLESIAGRPDERVSRLPLEGAAECERRRRGARAPVSAPASGRIEREFALRVAEQPDAVAVVDADGTISYRELDENANRLARWLGGAGLGESRRVGVFVERGRELAVALLGVLKAGATAVPLDPEHPTARLVAVLDDAGVSRIVTVASLATRLPVEGRRVLCMDTPSPSDAPADAADAVDAAAEDVACVLYTSGTTGRPKGARIAHAAVIGLVRDTDYVRLGPNDVVAGLANPAFDATTFEVFGALLNGARYAPIPKAAAIAPRALRLALRERAVTTAFVTTALFNAVAREAPDAFSTCRQVLFGGEAAEPDRVRDVFAAGAPGRLVHVYGPTETTTFATWHEVRADDLRTSTIPIGRPIAGAEVLILDGEGAPVPPGVPGEIAIGGNGVARGYLNRPDLTAERFVRHPFDPDPDARIYRTGDRGRLRADGAILFAGRFDRQVKIRGNRIELDEVESALARVPGVRSAVVALRGSTSDTRRLVAWLVASDPTVPPPDHVRRELRRQLPDAMLPSAIVWVESLPLTANGKVDVAALPEPGDAVRPGAGAGVPPRDMFEGVLARIFGEVLGVRGVGVFDRFFEIGGHSLSAARLVDAIERETGLALPLTALFADDTVDGVARVLRDGLAPTGSPIVAVNVSGGRVPVVFLHGDFQAGGFYSLALARALGADQPTWVVHPHGLAGDEVPATIEAMAAERVRVLRERLPHGPYVMAGHCNGALVAFEMARQLAGVGEPVPAVVLIEARAPASGGGPGEPGSAYVKFDASGRPTVLSPHDRLSDVELRYNRAIDAYAGGAYDGHLVVIQAQEWRHPAPDAGWSRFARSCEAHVLPGGHVTLITEHLALLARTIGEAVDRALARRVDRGPERRRDALPAIDH